MPHALTRNNADMTRERQPSIPEIELSPLRAALTGLAEPALSMRTRGRFCYIDYDGEPLCRFAYRADRKRWNFTVYKYSTGAYGELELGPDPGRPAQCVAAALTLYDLR